jgi:hypothetical protein
MSLKTSLLKKCKYCVHMYINGKMIPVETTPRILETERKENVEEVNSCRI